MQMKLALAGLNMKVHFSKKAHWYRSVVRKAPKTGQALLQNGYLGSKNNESQVLASLLAFETSFCSKEKIRGFTAHRTKDWFSASVPFQVPSCARQHPRQGTPPSLRHGSPSKSKKIASPVQLEQRVLQLTESTLPKLSSSLPCGETAAFLHGIPICPNQSPSSEETESRLVLEHPLGPCHSELDYHSWLVPGLASICTANKLSLTVRTTALTMKRATSRIQIISIGDSTVK
jgi:hypothetical protein